MTKRLTPEEIVDMLGNIANRPDIEEMKAKQLKAIKEYSAEIDALQAENVCDACMGTGTPASKLPCMCRGTGKMSEAARYLREEAYALRAALGKAVEVLEFTVASQPPPNSGLACVYCDMGDAGYSSNGSGYNDDRVGHQCVVSKCYEVLAELHAPVGEKDKKDENK